MEGITSLRVTGGSGDEHTINYTQLKKASLTLRSLNHQLRQQILQLLASQPSLSVTEIYKHFKLEQSVVSQHLAILRRASIVSARRSGKSIHYSINNIRICEVMNAVEHLLS